ncbi:MAG: GNAT family N-acetyltransferase [Leptolyngbyaceae cyanobacterium]
MSSRGCRSTKLADRLINYLLGWARDCRYQRVVTEVACDNLRATKFYQKQGFQEITDRRMLGDSRAVKALIKRL